MKVTSKGQVTIPLAIRRKLGLLPDSEVEFELRGDAALIRRKRAAPGRGRAIVERVRGRATSRLSTEEILALTREP